MLMKKQFLLGLVAMLLPLTSWAQEESAKKKITADYEESVTYAGKDTKESLHIELKAGDTPLTEGRDYWLTSTLDGEPISGYGTIHDAGNYEVTVELSPVYSKEYECDPLIFEVKKLDVSETGIVTSKDGLKTLTKPYGDELNLNEFIEVDVTKLAAHESADETKELEDFLSGLYLYELGATDPLVKPEVGTHSVAVTGKATGNTSNYIYNRPAYGLTIELVIEKKQLYIALAGKVYNTYQIVTEKIASEKTYTLYMDEANEEKATSDITGKLELTFTYDPTDNLDGDGEPIEKAINAGIYKIRAEITGGDEAKHYTLGTDDVEYTLADYEISKANLVIEKLSNGTFTKTYGATDPVLNNQFTYNRKGSNNDAALVVTSPEFSALNLVMVREEGENVYTANNTKAEYKIYPAAVGDNTKTQITQLTNYVIVYDYNGTANNSVKSVLTIDPLTLDKAHNGIADADSITFTVNAEDLEKALVYIGKDYAAEANRTEVVDIVKGFFTVKNKKNNETLTCGTHYDIKVTGQEVNSWKAINAGEGMTIGLYGKGNYTGKLYKGGLTIKKNTLKIKTKEGAVFAKLEDGQGSGDLSMTHFEYEGLKEVDEEGKPNTAGVLELKAWESGVGTHYSVHLYNGEGEYVGAADYKNESPEKGLKNYIVDYTLEYFDILAANLTLYGDETQALEGEESNIDKLKKYNGMSDVTVTIKNVKELMTGNDYLAKNAWHSMALPFATTAKDISNAFGYAVVNIPNQSNATAGEIAFKLTVGEVEANHLFLVKLADRKNFGAEGEITFKGVTINYNPDGDGNIWVKDAGDNFYYAVYETKELEKDPSLFVASRPGSNGGGFFSPNKYDEAKTVYALNGYIKSGAKNPAETRFIIEEADGSTTAINTITGETSNSADSWYSIGGMKMNAQPTQKGVYINNGKKVVIK